MPSMRPLYGGCPYLGGSVMEGWTGEILQGFFLRLTVHRVVNYRHDLVNNQLHFATENVTAGITHTRICTHAQNV